MSCFICEKCGCIDNCVGGGNYWYRLKDEDLSIPLLCTECNTGKWHNKFPKEHWSTKGTKDELLENAKEYKKTEELVNIESYFKNH